MRLNADKAFGSLSFEDRFGMLIDKEWDKRKSNKLQKLIRIADFRYPNACMEDIEYHADRKLDKAQLLQFSACRYIFENHHIILKGASGNGKTYIASALGIAACRNFVKVRYIRLPDLLNELAVAHGEGTFEKVIKTYQKVDLLILDEFLLSPLASDQARELLEIIEARTVRGSIIFCTQFEPGDWYGRIGNESDATVSSHTSWNCKYHIIFAPKYRRQVIYGKIRVDTGKIHNVNPVFNKEKMVLIYENGTVEPLKLNKHLA